MCSRMWRTLAGRPVSALRLEGTFERYEVELGPFESMLSECVCPCTVICTGVCIYAHLCVCVCVC